MSDATVPQDYQIAGDLGIADPVKDGEVIKGGDLTDDVRKLSGDTPIGIVVPEKLDAIKADPKWKGEPSAVSSTGVPELGGQSVADGSGDAQIDRLARFIVDNVPGEPSESGGAVDCAIRIIARSLEAAPTGNESDLREEVEFYRAAIREHWESTQTAPRDECDQDLKLWKTLERPLP